MVQAVSHCPTAHLRWEILFFSSEYPHSGAVGGSAWRGARHSHLVPGLGERCCLLDAADTKVTPLR